MEIKKRKTLFIQWGNSKQRCYFGKVGQRSSYKICDLRVPADITNFNLRVGQAHV